MLRSWIGDLKLPSHLGEKHSEWYKFPSSPFENDSMFFPLIANLLIFTWALITPHGRYPSLFKHLFNFLTFPVSFPSFFLKIFPLLPSNDYSPTERRMTERWTTQHCNNQRRKTGTPKKECQNVELYPTLNMIQRKKKKKTERQYYTALIKNLKSDLNVEQTIIRKFLTTPMF